MVLNKKWLVSFLICSMSNWALAFSPFCCRMYSSRSIHRWWSSWLMRKHQYWILPWNIHSTNIQRELHTITAAALNLTQILKRCQFFIPHTFTKHKTHLMGWIEGQCCWRFAQRRWTPSTRSHWWALYWPWNTQETSKGSIQDVKHMACGPELVHTRVQWEHRHKCLLQKTLTVSYLPTRVRWKSYCLWPLTDMEMYVWMYSKSFLALDQYFWLKWEILCFLGQYD